MISQPMKKLLKSGAAFQAMFENAQRLADLHGTENTFDFSLGNPSAPPPPAIKEAIIQLLQEKTPTEIHSYTTPSGLPYVRQAVAENLNASFGTAYTHNNIVLSASAAGALSIIFRVLLNPGDEVIVFSPYFGDYEAYIEAPGGQMVLIDTEPTGFLPDAERLAAALTPKTRAVLINSPNNPTGRIYSSKILKELAAVLTEKSALFGAPIYLIADEPYRYLAYDRATVPYVPDFYPHTFVCYSFSKVLSLPGARIGYVVVPDSLYGFSEMTAALSVANRISIINAPSLFQQILPACLEERVDLSIYDKNRHALYEMLTELGFSCTYPEGAFYLFPKSPIPDDDAFCQIAQKHQLVLVPGFAFGCPGYFRVAYCVSYEKILRSRPHFAALAVETLR